MTQITWLVEGHSNSASTCVFGIEIDVFVKDGVMYVEQDWLDEHEGNSGSESAGYAEMYVDGTPVPDGIDAHPRVEA